MNALDALKQLTVVVADTGSFESMRLYQPQDATTNPTLIIRALAQEPYAGIAREVQARYRDRPLADRCRQVLIQFGLEILRLIPGRVSTEVDARLSFDTEGTVREAERIIEAYAKDGVSPDRILIKIAATWEGVRAAESLEKKGIHCNLTLMFSLAQAAVCADAGATLISPFVGRISDWHKKQGTSWASADQDPGVTSVRRIYRYLKRHGYATEVMGASFRSAEQVLALAGCDLLTVSPDLLDELRRRELPDPLTRRIAEPSASDTPGETLDKLEWSASGFRMSLNEDAMASEKLAEGIRLFVADSRKLEGLLGA